MGNKTHTTVPTHNALLDDGNVCELTLIAAGDVTVRLKLYESGSVTRPLHECTHGTRINEIKNNTFQRRCNSQPL